jgi:hypothetical protein
VNQAESVRAQLDNGVRGLSLDTHWYERSTWLCWTGIGAGQQGRDDTGQRLRRGLVQLERMQQGSTSAQVRACAHSSVTTLLRRAVVPVPCSAGFPRTHHLLGAPA